MSPSQRLRVLTYNVHRCVGRDRRLSPGRIAEAIAEQRPDVVALQELDVGRARTNYVNQAAAIAEALGMSWFFHPALQDRDESYGDALLSRYPMSLRRSAALPTLPNRPRLERRGALWVDVEWQGGAVHFLTTHLGLNGRERLAQVEALLSPDWLGHPERQRPLALCGDLNALPGTRAYRRLRSVLHDPVPWRRWPRGTFPSGLPVLRIDHVLLCPRWLVHRVEVPRTRLTRVASDHLPLLVEVSLSGEKIAKPVALPVAPQRSAEEEERREQSCNSAPRPGCLS
jgi:endonuclease/exonuclease/phosphatase family metal-dependent hydrolase